MSSSSGPPPPGRSFLVGERVEAIWSSDGQKYPGRIVHAFPNDNYDVLFDDGVKSRRKSNLIFKLGPPTPPTATEPEPVPPSNSDSDTAPNKPVPPINQNNSKEEEGEPSVAPEGEKPPPTSSNGSKRLPTKLESSVTEEEQSGTPPPTSTTDTPVVDSSAPGDSSSPSKGGFVYVQQPHYSVFDPPPSDLGKRTRRVHNYSKLAKGPSLRNRGGPHLNGGGGGEELLDGESITPTSTPSSSKPNSRSNSPSLSSGGGVLLNNHAVLPPLPPLLSFKSITNKPRGGGVSQGQVSKVGGAPNSSVKKVTPIPTPPARGSRYMSKRRFLKSPPKLGAGGEEAATLPPPPPLVPMPPPTNSNSEALLLEETAAAAADIQPSTEPITTPISTSASHKKKSIPKPIPPPKNTTTPTTTPNNRDISVKKSGETVSTPPPLPTASTPPVVVKKSHKKKIPEFVAPVLPPPVQVPPPSGEEESTIPSKRLRKPSHRFSAEEGYVDIFSQPRRTRRSSPLVAAVGKSQASPRPPPPAPVTSSPFAGIPLGVGVDQSSTPTSTPPTTPGPERTKKRKRGRQPGFRPVKKVPPPPLIPIGEAAPPSTLASPHSDSTLTNHQLPPAPGVEEEDELLDIGGDYTLHQSQTTATPSASPSPPKRPRTRNASGLSAESGATPATSTSLVAQRPIRQTSRSGRVVRPPPLKTETAESIMDRFSASNLKVLVEKCDYVIPSTSKSGSRRASSSSTSGVESRITNISHKFGAPPSGASLFSGPPPTNRDEEDVDVDEDEDAPISSIPTTNHNGSSSSSHHKQRWRKKRFTKGRASSSRGIDSHALQLLKRSRLQSSIRPGGAPGPAPGGIGRPKVHLLKGITKKRLKKITESIRRRKLSSKKIPVPTKFKDVRVDIINCVCGRTDEFGLMVQCEVCMCWQHGNCFGYWEGSTLPRFYVCQSCGSPKNVRPSHKTEGIRMESYKKGILPSFPYAAAPSLKQQRIFKRCHDLTRLLSSIESCIRQNRLKELIATAEPEHRKLYQWSAPRPHPKDLVQKWTFNKYYKPVLRRLILRHKGKPDYMDHLSNALISRDKLKKYGAAFEDAKLAISRKIGSRGLILVDKLSEQEAKLGRITRVKEGLDKELAALPESMRASLLSQMMDKNGGGGLEEIFSVEAFTPPTLGGSELGAPPTMASPAVLEQFLDKFSELLGQDKEESSREEGEGESQQQEEDVVQIKTEPIDPDEEESTNYHNSSLASSSSFRITHNENAELAQEIARFNLQQLTESGVPILGDDEEEDNWVEMKVKESPTSSHNTSASSDMIKLMLSKSGRRRATSELNLTTTSSQGSFSEPLPPVVVDVESESTLSGDTTVSVEDSEGGEEYWYNPITQLNTEYDAMRRLLLLAPLEAEETTNLATQVLGAKKKEEDETWNCGGEGVSATLRQDWMDELDFYLNGDLGLSLDSISDSGDEEEEDDSYPALSSDDEESGESDSKEGYSESPELSLLPPFPSSDEEDKEEKEPLRFWQKALLHKEYDSDHSLDKKEEEWSPEEAPDSSSEEEEEVKDAEVSQNNTKSLQRSVSGGGQEHGPPPTDLMFVCSGGEVDPVVPGEVIDVRLRVQDKPCLRQAMVVGGAKGEHFIKLLDTEDKDKSESLPLLHQNPSAALLCPTCSESLGVKWSWKQLDSAKGVNIILEDTLASLAEEVERARQLGLATLDARVALHMDINQITQFNNHLKASLNGVGQDTTPPLTTAAPPTSSKTNPDFHQPGKLTEICRQVLSKPRQSRNRQKAMSSAPTSKSNLASAEEESILTLLSLSKTPPNAESSSTPSNGENGDDNVSELSIESLRKLTDRLSQGGSAALLSQDLAKAVTGPLPPPTNGKIPFPSGLHKLESNKSTPAPPLCVRCSLQSDSASKMVILLTRNPFLAEKSLAASPEAVSTWCTGLSEAVEDFRLATHATRAILLYSISLVGQRKRAERTARELGVKLTPSSMKRRLQIARPLAYLSATVAEYVDALLPYATYFISRFTRKDQVAGAKKAWISAMISNYNTVKRTLRGMYSEGEEEEDKFYAALDNLRKSFDIVLTKKDIKMRRQNNSLSVSEETKDTPTTTPNNNGNNGKDVKVPSPVPEAEAESNQMEVDEQEEEEVKTEKVEESETTTPQPLPLVNGLNGEEELEPMNDGVTSKSSRNNIEEVPQSQHEQEPCPVVMEEATPTSTPTQEQLKEQEQLEEMEILARLATYPIQVEDVNALLGIANEQVVSDGTQDDTPPPTTTTENGGETPAEQPIPAEQPAPDQPLELDDFRLIEENLGGELDLINSSLGGGGGGVFKMGGGAAGEPDSDLLLNVFDDPLFSEPPVKEEPLPCSSKSVTNRQPPRPTLMPMAAPSLAKLTPEMCRGFLLDDIKAHQQIVDNQLDKLEAEIMELERRRGNGLKDKDDHKLFEMLNANMQILLENADVLHELTGSSVGMDNEEMGPELEDIPEHGHNHHHGFKREESEEDDLFVLK